MAHHTCYWTGCERSIPGAMLMCRPHWFSVPKPLRDRVWENYRSGQEVDGELSNGYVEVLRDIKADIAVRLAMRADASKAKTAQLPLAL